jgi:hypothetical protein
MRRLLILFVLPIAAATLAACGSSSTTSTGSAATTTTPELFSSKSYEQAKPNPSISAKMICEKEAQADIASSLGIKATRVTQPTWIRAQHVYSCTYVYPNGNIVLSVKEMSSASETTAYYNSIVKQYGTIQPLTGLGQGAWVLKNDDVVVRKDYKVLLVNVAGIPKKFQPLLTSSDVAINVAVSIMGCWSGA